MTNNLTNTTDETTQKQAYKTVKIAVPQIPDEIFLALFGKKKGKVTHIERGINPGFTILSK